MTNSVVEVRNLSRRFGRTLALDGVSLSVPRGVVLGLVGVNGSGKTTLLRHILGLLQAESGSVRTFGLDPVAEPVAVLSRIGYLAEDCDLPGWMRLGELLRYTAAFHRHWDADYAERLCRQFALDRHTRVRALSRGQKARAALIVALAYRPELLVLDEPSAGLDPLARRDILTAVIRTVAEEGRTVLFSSHHLDEVQRIADRLALLDRGRIVFEGALDEVRDRHRRLVLRFSEPRDTAPDLAGVLRWEGGGREWIALCLDEIDAVSAAAVAAGGHIVEQAVPGLEEVFVAHAERRE